ncbi:Hcr1p [Lipomyces oligophaga]|uniref:Hcr1p n=1 Tax=Lipomyces oligophaga TaxID=45792 RepID=UPI0034CE5AAC
MAWDDEEDEVPSSLTPKSKWDDEEDSDDGVLDSWDASSDDSDDSENKKKTTATTAVPAKKKVPLAQKIAEREAAKKAEQEERRKKLAELAESENDRRTRLRQAEIDADMDNAATLFGASSIDDSDIAAGNGSLESDPKPAAAAVKTVVAAPPLSSITLNSLPMFKAKSQAELDYLQDQLSEALKLLETHRNYASNFLPALLKAIAAPLNSEQVKKLASTLSAIGNEKLREERLAEKPKSGKGKKKPSLAAASAKIDDNIDTTNYDQYNDFDDFM